MRIEQLQYHDKALEWQLERMDFSDLTLLVGVSGVGKTRILRSLQIIKMIAEGYSLNGIQWEIIFSTIEGYRYRWCGEFENKQHSATSVIGTVEGRNIVSYDSEIVSESLHKDEQEIARRNRQEIILNGKKTPKLSPTCSIISLLSQEESIQPARQAFRRILSSELPDSRYPIGYLDNRSFETLANEYNTIRMIQESEFRTQLKLALVFKSQPAVFKKIRDRFLEIFPQVTDIIIEPQEDLEPTEYLSKIPQLKIQEEGVLNWIYQPQISSGMLRTLFHIAEMYLWPEGTVILIDEFENSLGVNCIDVLTEDLLQQHRKLQFIITSHHPYIINNIGPKYWKIVQREGGIVTTHDASSLGLGESSHEAFIQLINSDAYQEGIATR